jgi:hypothetical protein
MTALAVITAKVTGAYVIVITDLSPVLIDDPITVIINAITYFGRIILRWGKTTGPALDFSFQYWIVPACTSPLARAF